jgi:uncharacterized membrane protein
MSVGTFFLAIILVVVLVMVGISVVGYLSSGARDSRAELREARQMALAAKAREKIATKALRSIANGAGNPQIEASIALDEIEAYYQKELNS